MAWVRWPLCLKREKGSPLLLALIIISSWVIFSVNINVGSIQDSQTRVQFRSRDLFDINDTIGQSGVDSPQVQNTQVVASHVQQISVQHYINNFTLDDKFPLDPDDIHIIGKKSPRRFLAIGIPTIYREDTGTDYVEKTLRSLVRHFNDEEKEKVVILIFPSNFNVTLSKKVIELVQRQHAEHLQSGFIQIMQISQSAYPNLKNLKRNYNDAPERVYWRSKQVADFAFMFHYGKDLADYYMQIEDDVISSLRLYDKIREGIKRYKGKNWAVLEFSALGFIGKLFHATDLDRLAKFLMLFYAEQPVDWLYIYFFKLLTQKEKIIVKPAIFQHFGLRSSLKENKDKTVKKPLNKLKEKVFADPDPADIADVELASDVKDKQQNIRQAPKIPDQFPPVDLSSTNPSAQIQTSLATYLHHKPVHAYASSPDIFFWGKAPKINDTFTIVFTKSIELQSVSIHTGHKTQQNDFLREGVVELSSTLATSDSGGLVGECVNYTELGQFDGGQFIASNVTDTVKCLRVRVTASQEEWVIVSSIDIKQFYQGQSTVIN